MFGNCSSWPPVRVSRFRPFLSYMENPWAPGHISKCEGGTGGSIALFSRGAVMHFMNFRTSIQNFYQKLFVMGGGHSTARISHYIKQGSTVPPRSMVRVDERSQSHETSTQ